MVSSIKYNEVNFFSNFVKNCGSLGQFYTTINHRDLFCYFPPTTALITYGSILIYDQPTRSMLFKTLFLTTVVHSSFRFSHVLRTFSLKGNVCTLWPWHLSGCFSSTFILSPQNRQCFFPFELRLLIVRQFD